MQLSCVRLLVGKYGEKLLKSDIDPRHIRSFPNRVGASIYSVAVMDSLVEMGEGKKELYHSLKRVGYDLRRKMLKQLDYLFRNNKDARNKGGAGRPGSASGL